ncbi:MAG: Crp/Fnr family transcriptional regulator [Synechococcales cyanobacterium RM1_1_8]|nr:Crp/Fnr family transcriptional regulator [Synechococcales cyanobacterium RM1_1_8]
MFGHVEKAFFHWGVMHSMDFLDHSGSSLYALVEDIDDKRSFEQCDSSSLVNGSHIQSNFSQRRQNSLLKATVSYFRRRETIEIQQGCLWKIEEGFVKTLSWDSDGYLIILGIWGPGESLGSPLGEINPVQNVCITPVRLQLQQRSGEYPYEFIWNQARQTQELFNLFRCRCLQSRIYNLLWWLAGRFGSEFQMGRLTGVPLTHQDIADLCGSTRVTVTRLLGQLKEDGKIAPRNRQLFLKAQPFSGV